MDILSNWVRNNYWIRVALARSIIILMIVMFMHWLKRPTLFKWQTVFWNTKLTYTIPASALLINRIKHSSEMNINEPDGRWRFVRSAISCRLYGWCRSADWKSAHPNSIIMSFKLLHVRRCRQPVPPVCKRDMNNIVLSEDGHVGRNCRRLRDGYSPGGRWG